MLDSFSTLDTMSTLMAQSGVAEAGIHIPSSLILESLTLIIVGIFLWWLKRELTSIFEDWEEYTSRTDTIDRIVTGTTHRPGIVHLLEDHEESLNGLSDLGDHHSERLRVTEKRLDLIAENALERRTRFAEESDRLREEEPEVRDRASRMSNWEWENQTDPQPGGDD